MNLRWRRIEGSLRKRIRAELLASPPAWREYRRARRLHRRRLPPWISQGFIQLLLLGAGANWLVQGVQSPGQYRAFTVAWILAAVCWQMSWLRGLLYYDHALSVLGHLPVSDQNVFSVQWKSFLRQSLKSLPGFSVLHGVLAWKVGFGSGCVWVGLVLAAVQCVMITAMAVSLTSVLPAMRFDFGTYTCGAAALAILFLPTPLRVLSDSLNHLGPWIPGNGWIWLVLGITPTDGRVHDLVPALAMGCFLAWLPVAARKLRRNYALFELNHATPLGSAAALIGDAEAATASESFTPPKPKPLEVEAWIRKSGILVEMDWRNQGPFGRGVSAWLRGGERAVAEFLLGGQPEWTCGLTMLALPAAALIAMWFLVPQILAHMAPFAVMFLLVFLWSYYGGFWSGFDARHASGTLTPLYAVFPITFRQICSVTLKVNLARTLLILPLLAVISSFSGLVLDFSLHASGMLAVKLPWLLLACQPLVVIGLVSPLSNDSSKPRLFVPALLLAFILLGLIGWYLWTPFIGDAVLLGLILGVLSAGILAWYARRFNRNAFDLQKKNQSEMSPSSD